MMRRIHESGVRATLIAALVLLPACGTTTIPGLGSGERVTLDGQTCTVGSDGIDSTFTGTDCQNAADWENSRTRTTEEGDIYQRTRLAHRHVPPVVIEEGSEDELVITVPSDSLFVAFETAGAAPLDHESFTMVGLAVSPDSLIANARAYEIWPALGLPPAGGSEIDRKPAQVESFTWNAGAGEWELHESDPDEITVRYAYNWATSYWGVEIRLHLPTIDADEERIRAALFWQTRDEDGGLVRHWRPSSAQDSPPGTPPFLPDPEEWTAYSFLHPDASE